MPPESPEAVTSLPNGPTPGNQLTQAVPALLTAAVLGLAGLFVQVAKLGQSMDTVMQDVQEMKNDLKERVSKLEDRVRQLEITSIRAK
jgi:uncharacterized protein YoxC